MRIETTSPVMRTFARQWQGALDEEQRRALDAVIAQAPVRVDEETERLRGLMALDWLVRTAAPAWLRLVPSLVPHAEQLEQLPDLTGAAVSAVVSAVVRDANDAARNAAMAAARDAAWAAARAAAWAATWDAAVAAARAAAWNAAWAAAWDATLAAAWAAARAVAKDAAALAPTVATLQASALDLLRRMSAA